MIEVQSLFIIAERKKILTALGQYRAARKIGVGEMRIEEKRAGKVFDRERRLAKFLESETAIVECRCPELRTHRIDPERRLVILDGFFELAGPLMSESAIEKGVRKLLGGKLARLDRLRESGNGVRGLACDQRLIALGNQACGRGPIGGLSATGCRWRSKKRGTYRRKQYVTDSHGVAEWDIKVKA